MLPGSRLPSVTFRTRVRDESIAGPNPYRWQDMTTEDYFGGKRVVLFALPGAFTPTCSTFQLPGFEQGFAGLAIGLTLAAIHLVGINVTGVSVNPARSIGPALFVGGKALADLWVFIVAPLAGGAVAGLAHASGFFRPGPIGSEASGRLRA